MFPLRRVLPLLFCILPSGALGADELPARAIARLGSGNR